MFFSLFYIENNVKKLRTYEIILFINAKYLKNKMSVLELC